MGQGCRDGTARHRIAVRVYYEDTDFSGAVYHANYLRYMERARTEFLRDLGIHQGALLAAAGAPLGFVVRRMTIDFLKPARMDDLLDVETRLVAVGGASLDMIQEVVRGGNLLARAEVRAAVVAGGRAKRLPPDLRARMDSLVDAATG